MNNKIKTKEELKKIINGEKKIGKKIVITNGAFDILHPAHLRVLEKAKSLGDVLIVLLNSDISIKRLKGKRRPINPQKQRAEALSCLPWIDYLIIFDEDKPLNLIEFLGPHLLVKGGAFLPERLKEEDKLMRELGGQLITFPLEHGYSTTEIIQRVLDLHKKEKRHLIRKIRKKIRGIGKKIGFMDDFNWSEYSDKEYSKQISELEKEYTFILPEGKYSIIDGKIILDPSLLPLHENHKVLYETIYALKPRSILEVGCGCGDHLANIKKILPEVELNGLDLLQRQLEFLFQRHPELKNQAHLSIKDITISSLERVKVDLVFTQAVLMHIQRHKHYLSALKNIFNNSKRFVVLMENWTRHNFIEDIKKISKMPDFAWENVYFYTNNTGQKKALILSLTPLAEFYELKNNKELLKYYD